MNTVYEPHNWYNKQNLVPEDGQMLSKNDHFTNESAENRFRNKAQHTSSISIKQGKTKSSSYIEVPTIYYKVCLES